LELVKAILSQFIYEDLGSPIQHEHLKAVMSHLMADPLNPRLMLVIDTNHSLFIILDIFLIDQEDGEAPLEVGSKHEVVIAVQALNDLLKMPDRCHFIVEALPGHEVPRVVVPPEVLAPGVMEVLV
jgi:hypothetical protein